MFFQELPKTQEKEFLKYAQKKAGWKGAFKKREMADSQEGGYGVMWKTSTIGSIKLSFPILISGQGRSDSPPDDYRPPLKVEIKPKGKETIIAHTWHAPHAGMMGPWGTPAAQSAFKYFMLKKETKMDIKNKGMSAKCLWFLIGDLNLSATGLTGIINEIKLPSTVKKKGRELDHCLAVCGDTLELSLLSIAGLRNTSMPSDHFPLGVSIKYNTAN